MEIRLMRRAGVEERITGYERAEIELGSGGVLKLAELEGKSLIVTCAGGQLRIRLTGDNQMTLEVVQD